MRKVVVRLKSFLYIGRKYVQVSRLSAGSFQNKKKAMPSPSENVRKLHELMYSKTSII